MFRGPNGVGSVSVTTAGRRTGEGTIDFKREEATKRDLAVSDLDAGDEAYVAASDQEGEAVVINAKGSYTITVSDLGAAAEIERLLKELAAAIPA